MINNQLFMLPFQLIYCQFIIFWLVTSHLPNFPLILKEKNATQNEALKKKVALVKIAIRETWLLLITIVWEWECIKYHFHKLLSQISHNMGHVNLKPYKCNGYIHQNLMCPLLISLRLLQWLHSLKLIMFITYQPLLATAKSTRLC